MTKSTNYSKHSSLMTDLSLTPSPDHDSSLHHHDQDTVHHQQSVSRVVEESLSTPDDEGQDDDETSGHYNSPTGDNDDESMTPPFSPVADLNTSTCTTPAPASSTPPVQDNSATDIQHSFHDDILNLPSDLTDNMTRIMTPCSLPPKLINNNSSTGQSSLESPSYCSPSPVYSIPSPGSAFSIVISKRRESETWSISGDWWFSYQENNTKINHVSGYLVLHFLASFNVSFSILWNSWYISNLNHPSNLLNIIESVFIMLTSELCCDTVLVKNIWFTK